MDNLSGTQINIVFGRLGIATKIATILQTVGIATTLCDDIEILIRNFLGGHISPEEFASGLRLLGIDDSKLKQFVELFKKDIFVPVYTEVEIVKKEQAEIEQSYNTPIEEEPEDIMHNAGIEIDEQPTEEVAQPQSNENEIVANINKREMKTFSNAGISFDELPSQNELTRRMGPVVDTTNKNMSEKNLMEAIEHPTKSEPVIFKGIAQTKMNSTFGIPSTKSDQSLPRLDNISSRTNDVYREEI